MGINIDIVLLGRALVLWACNIRLLFWVFRLSALVLINADTYVHCEHQFSEETLSIFYYYLTTNAIFFWPLLTLVLLPPAYFKKRETELFALVYNVLIIVDFTERGGIFLDEHVWTPSTDFLNIYKTLKCPQDISNSVLVSWYIKLSATAFEFEKPLFQWELMFMLLYFLDLLPMFLNRDGDKNKGDFIC